MFVGRIFDKINTWYKKLIFGGILLGILIFLFPSLYGEGYEAINSALRGDFSYLFDNSIFYNYKDSLLVTIGLIFIFRCDTSDIAFSQAIYFWLKEPLTFNSLYTI